MVVISDYKNDFKKLYIPKENWSVPRLACEIQLFSPSFLMMQSSIVFLISQPLNIIAG